MELYSRHPTALGNGRQAIMESLNDIMGRTMPPRRLSNPTQQQLGAQQLHPNQGNPPAAQSPQTEPALRPLAQRRLTEQTPQSWAPDSPTQPEAPHAYG